MSRAGRRSVSPPLVAAALALVLALGALAIVLGSGGDEKPSGSPPLQAGQAKQGRGKERPQSAQAPQQTPAEPPARTTPAAPATGGAAEGERLNKEGFDLFRQGRYAEAIPILRRAVRAFPPGTTDLDYAYALYNLGASLRRAGRADEAIPILERRLRIPNQQGTVKRELDAARREAGR